MYHNLRAAQGFLELGDPDSAWEELELIPAEERANSLVLRMRVYIYREKKKWMEMAEVSRHLTEIDPNQSEHWTNKAWAERRHLGLTQAEQTLLQALEKFPEDALIHYNLACYACVSGRIDEGKQRLETALRIDPDLKATALEDDDLVRVW